MLDIRLRKRLENFTLELELAAPPGITALFGHSGAGKSMTLACVAGLNRPDAGHVFGDGRPPRLANLHDHRVLPRRLAGSMVNRALDAQGAGRCGLCRRGGIEAEPALARWAIAPLR